MGNALANQLLRTGKLSGTATLALSEGQRYSNVDITNMDLSCLQGQDAITAAQRSAVWAREVIKTVKCHETQKVLLAKEKRTTVLAAATTNRDLSPEMAERLLKLALQDHEDIHTVNAVLNLPNLPISVTLEAVAEIQDRIPNYQPLWIPVQAFTVEHLEAALHSPNTRLAASAFIATRTKHTAVSTDACRRLGIEILKERGDIVEIVESVITSFRDVAFEAEELHPVIAEAIVEAIARNDRQVDFSTNFTEEALAATWEAAKAGDIKWLAAYLRAIPTNPKLLNDVLADGTSTVAAAAVKHLPDYNTDVDPQMIHYANKLARQITDPDTPDSALEKLLQWPLDEPETLQVLRNGSLILTGKWLGGLYKMNKPTRTMLGELREQPGNATFTPARGIRLAPDNAELDASIFTKIGRYTTNKIIAQTLEKDVISALPGVLVRHATLDIVNIMGVEMLADRLGKLCPDNPAAWKLAVELGEDYSGTVEELVDAITGVLA